MDEKFLKRLLATFKIEAGEHLTKIASELIVFEKSVIDVEKAKLIESIFREAHSLKGASRAVNLYDIETICQNLENLFAAIKKNEIISSPSLFDIAHAAVDLITKYLSIEEGAERSAVKGELDIVAGSISEVLLSDYREPQADIVVIEGENELISKDDISGKNREVQEQNIILPKSVLTGEEKFGSAETIRILASKLDSLLINAEEMLSSKLAYEQLTGEINALDLKFSDLKKNWNKIQSSMKKPGRKDNRLEKKENTNSPLEILEMIDGNSNLIKELDNKIRFLHKSTRQNNLALSVLIKTLIDDIKDIMMLPFSYLFDLIPKIVRDLSRDLRKEIDFEMTGSEIEVDRRILEELRDPLIHIIRNSIDHGIESPSERESKSKNPKGKISVSVFQQESNKVEILIEDDGRGINYTKVKSIAVKKGYISVEQSAEMTEEESMQLVFESDISTSSVITDISGRGLGMAIVKEKVEKLGGSIKIASVMEEGTKLLLTVPVTLSTFRGIIVSCDEKYFVVPTVYVEQALRTRKSEIKTVGNKETILVNSVTTSLVSIGDILGIKRKNTLSSSEFIICIVLCSSSKKAAFIIDDIFNEQEILVKPFNRHLENLKYVTGATILGDGKVVPILNIPSILSAVDKLGSTGIRRIDDENVEIKRDILVVDDSITSRMLIKDILESSGFSVKTASDGIDAITVLKTEKFDLVVSDVEMPRMDGFELTLKIRNDSTLRNLPVILITALAKQEDRERGIDSGANAYIVKSSFDQGNLLEIIHRLI